MKQVAIVLDGKRTRVFSVAVEGDTQGRNPQTLFRCVELESVDSLADAITVAEEFLAKEDAA